MTRSLAIPRRTFLRGMGTALALPYLEAMAPRAVAAKGAKPPLRVAYLYVPNGVHLPAWRPTKEGKDFDLPPILKPLEPVRKQMLVLSGLTLDKARANGDGGGDHARSCATFLTARQAFKTDGANIRVGVSVDQVLAEKLGRDTRFASLELGCEHGALSGGCDSGYSCAYSHSLSWRTPSTPLAKEVNPRQVFDRLFGTGEGDDQSARAQRERRDKSILDLVKDESTRLRTRLGKSDQRKLDEYFDSVREVERQISHAPPDEKTPEPGMDRPEGIPQEHADHIRAMGDLLAIAFQTDMTRVITLMFANEGSNKSYNQIDVPEAHHEISHHGNDAQKQAKIQKINTFHVEQLSYIIQKLASIAEGNGTLLDHSLVLYGSGIGDGDRHNHDDLPLLLFGRGNGAAHPGRHIRFPNETPLANLHLTMLDEAGIRVDGFGDSNGKLKGL